MRSCRGFTLMEVVLSIGFLVFFLGMVGKVLPSRGGGNGDRDLQVDYFNAVLGVMSGDVLKGMEKGDGGYIMYRGEEWDGKLYRAIPEGNKGIEGVGKVMVEEVEGSGWVLRVELLERQGVRFKEGKKGLVYLYYKEVGYEA